MPTLFESVFIGEARKSSDRNIYPTTTTEIGRRAFVRAGLIDHEGNGEGTKPLFTSRYTCETCGGKGSVEVVPGLGELKLDPTRDDYVPSVKLQTIDLTKSAALALFNSNTYARYAHLPRFEWIPRCCPAGKKDGE